MSECRKCIKCRQIKLTIDFYKQEVACKKCRRDMVHKKHSGAYLKKVDRQIRAQQKAYQQASVINLRPSYVAAVMGISTKNLTPELLALKREQLTTHRLSKQITQAIKAQGAPA